MYGKLFSSVFMLSACTFGGGYVIVPLMRKKFVEDLHWIEEGEMMDLVAIAQSSPGAIAVNASISIVSPAGILGQSQVIGTVLPPLVILTVISYCYEAFIQIRWIQSHAVFRMQARLRLRPSVMWYGRWAGGLESAAEGVCAHHAGSLCLQCFV